MKENWKTFFWGTVFILALLIWGMAVTYREAAKIHEYFRLEAIGVEVEAKVTKKKDTTDINDSPAYDLYITYSYNGETYSDVYYKESSKGNLYGKTVTVEIDPENPRNLRPLNLGTLVIYTAVGTMILVAAMWCAFRFTQYSGKYLASRSWKEFYSSPILSPEAVRRDLDAAFIPARKCSVWSLCIFALLVLAGSVKFYMEYGAVTVVPFYGIALAAAVLFFRNQGGTVNYLDIRQVTLQSIEVKHDSESDTDEFIWHFDTADWKPDDSIFVTLTARSLSSCQHGDGFYIVRPLRTVNGRKKDEILRIYDAREFRML